MNEPLETLRELAKTTKNGNGVHVGPPTVVEPPDNPPGSGSSNLSRERAAAVAYGLEQFQTMAHERDELRNENIGLKDRVAALEIEAEGLRSHINDAQSQIRSAMLVRDQALADRIKYEAMFVSFQAQLRAFNVPAEPLIRDADQA
jgi:chromosome segregation ATPase